MVMSKHDQLAFATTLDVRDNCLCLHLQRAARVVARRYDDALRPAQLTNGQFSLLMALNRPCSPNLSEVSELLGMDRTTLTANLKPLARRGLLKVAVDAQDRRSRRLHLTSAGRAALVIAMPLWTQAQAETGRRVQRTSRLCADLRALC